MVALCVLAAIAIRNPLTNPDVFPIGVWLQDPARAVQYKAAGFNLYVGLWEGPTEAQLATLKAAEMPVICGQDKVGLQHRNDPVIVGWMHQDEPDNAQEVVDAAGHKGYGPCVAPSLVVDRYRAMKAADPSRPVMLNLGQGVANDKWIGRGNGAKLDDYKTYVQGSDIVSFDVYPVAGLEDPSKISLVAKGIDRLATWTAGRRKIWNCLECTAISGKSKATPSQVAVEAWSSIIHGSRGFIYFVHQFEPKFDEHALLDDPEMLAAVTKLNGSIQSIASVLNRGSRIDTKLTGGTVDAVAIRYGKEICLITANTTPTEVVSYIRVPVSDSDSSGHDIVTGAEIPIKRQTVRLESAPFASHVIRFKS